MPRQERGVQVQAAERGDLQDGRRENLSIGHNDDGFGISFPDPGDGFLVSNFLRLQQGGHAGGTGGLLDGRLGQCLGAAGRPVRLGDKTAKLVARLGESMEGGHTDRAGAEEKDPHGRKPTMSRARGHAGAGAARPWPGPSISRPR